MKGEGWTKEEGERKGLTLVNVFSAVSFPKSDFPPVHSGNNLGNNFIISPSASPISSAVSFTAQPNPPMSNDSESLGFPECVAWRELKEFREEFRHTIGDEVGVVSREFWREKTGEDFFGDPERPLDIFRLRRNEIFLDTSESMEVSEVDSPFVSEDNSPFVSEELPDFFFRENNMDAERLEELFGVSENSHFLPRLSPFACHPSTFTFTLHPWPFTLTLLTFQSCQHTWCASFLPSIHVLAHYKSNNSLLDEEERKLKGWRVKVKEK